MLEEPHWFTIEEANRLLGQLKENLAALRGFRDELQELERKKAVEELTWLKEDGTVSPQAQTEIARLDQLQLESAGRFEKELTALHETGAELKDLEEGLIDFPTRRGDEQVYLCWKDGEDQIEYWHDLQSGVAGRRPIQEL